MKRIMNLMTVVILIYTVSVMPINTVVFGIDFSRVFAPPEELNGAGDKAGSVQYAFTSSGESLLKINPDKYQVFLDLSKPLSNELIKQRLSASLTVTDGLGHETEFDKEALGFELTQNQGRYTLGFDLSAEKLGLVSENYRFNLKVTMEKEVYEDEFKVMYANGALAPNGRAASEFKQPLFPYYFTDHTGQLSLPIYTATLAGKNPYRKMLATLNQVPAHPALAPQQAFPPVGNIWYSAGLMELKVNSKVIAPYADPQTQMAKMALQNVLRTAAQFERDTIINKVRISVDGSSASKAFGGIDLNTEFAVDRSPQAFVALVVGGQMLWYPVNVPQEENLTNMANTLIKGLIHPIQLITDPRVASVVPDVVAIKQATLVNGTLRVTFNEGIKTALGDRPVLVKTALEGLSLSLSTIPDVKAIELYAGETRIESIGGVAFGASLARPSYFNVLNLAGGN